MSLLMFPEGGTTNGSALLKFKKGAFLAECSLKPIVLNYSLESTVSPAYDVIELFPLACL